MPPVPAQLNNLRIVFFAAETYPSFAGGGRHAFYLARYLARGGARCTIASLNYNRTLINKELIDGVSIHRITYWNKSLLVKLLSLPPLFFQATKLVVKNKVVIVYGRYFLLYLFIIACAKLFGRKVIFRSTLNGDDDLPALLNRPLGFGNKLIFRHINLYLAINPQFEKSWKSVFGNRVPVLQCPQGFDATYFYPQLRKERMHVPNEIPLILSNAILVERKGYRILFEALSTLPFNFRYRIIGQYLPDPHHRSAAEELEEMSTLYQLGKKMLGKKVEFLNTVTDIRPHLAQADLFLYGAVQDGLPNAVLEAMATGLPVLMRNCKLDPQLFKPEQTVLEFENSAQLSQQLMRLRTDRLTLERIGQNATDFLLKNYTFDSVVPRILEQFACKKNQSF